MLFICIPILNIRSVNATKSVSNNMIAIPCQFRFSRISFSNNPDMTWITWFVQYMTTVYMLQCNFEASPFYSPVIQCVTYKDCCQLYLQSYLVYIPTLGRGVFGDINEV